MYALLHLILAHPEAFDRTQIPPALWGRWEIALADRMQARQAAGAAQAHFRPVLRKIGGKSIA